mgnify:CR=1 FL=1|tara:strand:- start:159 stop:779 length:621 start_codon:yes stop_codon:yes gene_type:complete
MQKLQDITQRYRSSYKTIKDLLLNPDKPITYNDETNVRDSPFYMIKAKENIIDIMGNIQLIKDDNDYSQILDDPSINFCLDHKMFYYIYKSADVQVIMEDFTFFSLSTLNKNKEDYDYFIDIAMSYIGMGHIYVISMIKATGKFFFRQDGGSNGYERLFTYQNYQHFEPTEEYSDKLFDFKKMIDIVQSRKNHPDQFSLNDLCIEK